MISKANHTTEEVFNHKANKLVNILFAKTIRPFFYQQFSTIGHLIIVFYRKMVSILANHLISVFYRKKWCLSWRIIWYLVLYFIVCFVGPLNLHIITIIIYIKKIKGAGRSLNLVATYARKNILSAYQLAWRANDNLLGSKSIFGCSWKIRRIIIA